MQIRVRSLFFKKGNMAAVRNADKTELFESMSIPRAVITLAIPTIISSLVTMIYNLVDTYFVGLVNDPVQNAAVTLAYPIILSLNAVNNLFGVGSSSMMSRALGVHDEETARRCSAFGFYCSVLCGLLYSLFVGLFMTPLLGILGAGVDTMAATRSYLQWTIVCGAAPAILNVVMAYMVRAEGASLHASIGTMSGCVLNILLDPFFILPWGLNMGAAGAGLATFLSNCVACIYFFVLLFFRRRKTVVCVNPKMFRPSGRIVKGVCGVGIPAAIQNLLNVVGMTILNNCTSAYGTEAVAAMGIAQKISHVPMMTALGLSQGVQPLIGYNYSSGNIKRMKSAFSFTAKIALTIMVVIAAVCWIFAGPLITLFMKDALVVEYGTAFLRAFSLGAPFLAVDFIGVGVYQSCGLGRYALFFALARKLLLEIPLIFILDAVWPMYGLPYSQAIAELILAVAACIVLLRLFRRLESQESNAAKG